MRTEYQLESFESQDRGQNVARRVQPLMVGVGLGMKPYSIYLEFF